VKPAQLPVEDQILRRVRQIGFGLVVAAIVLDAFDQEVLKLRLRASGMERRMLQRLEGKRSNLIEMGLAVLESVPGATTAGAADGSRPGHS
jgi:hypothetical protein